MGGWVDEWWEDRGDQGGWNEVLGVGNGWVGGEIEEEEEEEEGSSGVAWSGLYQLEILGETGWVGGWVGGWAS